MTDVDYAVLNNIIWCGIVCETHGLTPISSERIWGLLSKAPELYPDIITSSRQVTSDEVNNFIGNREVISIKDSFANLNMVPYGFEVLFDAEWICHDPVAGGDPVHTEWAVVSTEEDFAKWTYASGLQEVLKPTLLERKDVKIFLHEYNGERSGFIANLSANAIGISNVFSNSNIKIWSDIAPMISRYFPGIKMVGYESGDGLTAALSSGWTTIGPLRVWIRSKDSFRLSSYKG
ncbi:hypothetical protein FHS18_005211 [Paenibacillus phyllosphaerae]|uniref:Uncharacterized protein n=1 Tax=Paenibacillus phyllosphaerae TaxID=274593 RepID=A0A7W5B2G2_9BACL|nr:hypothetical protein [Paenibacillus phyllosphaerae]MBB3113108.1 hypothetical protein [Paenibacillus phyllosphaerae]